MGGRRIAEVVAFYARMAPETLGARLEEGAARQPACPVTRYLLGCHCLDRSRPATAARHFMVAHHAEPRLESAALLAFAGLTWVSRRGTSLLPVLLETFEDFRRPEFDRFPRERLLMDAFAETDPGLIHVAPLARRLWRLPIRVLRAQIRDAIVSRDERLYPQLIAPA